MTHSCLDCVRWHLWCLQSLSLPGYLATIAFIDRIGVVRLQNLGFVATAFFFFLLSGLQPYLNDVSGTPQ